MTPMNPAFGANVRHKMRDIVAIFREMKCNDLVYVSRHLCERAVERNVDPVDIARLTVPVIKAFRETTYNEQTFVVSWRQLRLVAKISLKPVTEDRTIILKTIIDPEVRWDQFDVEIKI